MTLDRGQLENILERLPSLTVGLVGDLFLDRYFEIDPDRTEVSIETGLDAYQVVRVRNQPGALGTVMNNLAALGVGRLVPITVIGEDGLGDDLIRALRSMPVEETGILRSDTHLTPTYLKPLVMERDQPPRELNRLDVRSREPLSSEWRRRVSEELSRRFAEVDGWIVLDQIDQRDEGVLHADVREALGDEARRHPEIPVIIDSRKLLGAYAYGSLKGNEHEFRLAAGCDDVEEAVRRLGKRTGRPAFATCGAKGICVAESGERVAWVPARPVTGPIDIVGAGDSATAALLCAMLSGVDARTAAAFANLVASITIRQLGTTGTATPAQIRREWESAGV